MILFEIKFISDPIDKRITAKQGGHIFFPKDPADLCEIFKINKLPVNFSSFSPVFGKHWKNKIPVQPMPFFQMRNISLVAALGILVNVFDQTGS